MIKPATAFFLCAALAGCANIPPEQPEPLPPRAAAPVRPDADDREAFARFDAAWAEYLATLAGADLQFGCRPRRYRPPPGMPRRGAVLALHGFSACGQQFFQLGPLLAEQGFDVLVPMLPGHGAPAGPDGEEDLSGVPTAENWTSSYGGLAAAMNRVMAESPGERVLVGYSLGGTVAINAAHRAPGVYDRMLLITPLIAIRGGGFIEGLGDLLGRTPGMNNWRVKPRNMQAECEAWTAAGRAGFCDYRLKHVSALVRLERQNRKWSEERPLSLPIQVILADDDKVVSNSAIERLVKEQRAHGPVAACVLNGGVPHEVLTPYENVGREMTWLDEFLRLATEFAVNDTRTSCQEK
jgi:alpha-beta hydrolase superfamily lysophospholipase